MITAAGRLDIIVNNAGILRDRRLWKLRQELEASIPLGRFAAPSEMAAATAFLASEEAGYITGAVLPVDGGISI